MEYSVTRVARILVPRLPRILGLLLFNKLSLSTNSDKQEAAVEATVYILRCIIGANPKRPLKYIQQLGLNDPGIKGKIWISKVTIATPPTVDVRDAVVNAIKILGDGRERYDLPDVLDVEAEWTGFRKDADQSAPRPEGDEKQQYGHLMRDVSSATTILYFHGGAHIMMDPITHRPTTSKLAELTGGRCLSVRYRLAPQNPFPAALIDALIAYLYLLSPPEESYHEPVPAKDIVMAGDSAGGNIVTALVLLLLTLRKSGVQSIQFHGKDVALELPGGMALNSPWVDIRRSLPSVRENARFDYLDPPAATGIPDDSIPSDEIWPTKPPRAELYCQATLLTHPLVSPVMAKSTAWAGAPPLFVCGGNEGLLDEYTVLARRVYQAGVPVEFVGYEGMPHCFAMVFSWHAATQDCYQRWAQFCTTAAQGRVERVATASWMKAFSNPLEFYTVSLDDMGIDDQEVDKILVQSKEIAVAWESDEVKRYTAQNLSKS